MSTALTTPDPSFKFPREHSFPPFFTIQPNATTRHVQLTKWSALVLSYARHHRIFRLSISSATASTSSPSDNYNSSSSSNNNNNNSYSPLFHNRTLGRRLSPSDIRDVLLLGFMRKEGSIEPVPGEGDDVVFVHWRRPEEWARVVEEYVEGTGMKGAVLTVYELMEGEGTRGTELHGMDRLVLLRALGVLVKKGKAQIFGQDDSQGVKFF